MFKKFQYKKEYQYPINIMLNLTDDCNLACKYCFVEQHPHYMTLDIAKQAVDWGYQNYLMRKENNFININQNGKPFLNFFGGEPMLLFNQIIKPLVFYIEEKYPNSFDLGITTNCTLLSKDRIDFLSEHNFSILCSIDGAEETQCYNRPCRNGDNSSKLIENNIRYLLKKIPSAKFRMTGYGPTIHNLFLNYKYAEMLGFQQYAMVIDERHKWTKQQILELQVQLQKIFYYQLIQQLTNNKYMHCIYFDVFNNLKDFLNKKELSSDFYLRCGLGTTSCAIGWDGKIYGCQQDVSLNKKNIFLIGNLNTGINLKKHIILLKKYSNSILFSKSIYCYNCKLQSYCHSFKSVCPSTNYFLFQNMFKKTKIRCIYLQTLYKLSVLNSIILLSFNQNNKKENLYGSK